MKISGFVKDSFRGVLDFIYTPACVLCQKRTEEELPLCPPCLDRVKADLEWRVYRGEEDFPHLSECLYFDYLIACWIYTPLLATLIHQVKYQRRKNLGLFLGETAGTGLMDRIGDVSDLSLVPVPLYRTRERERGYNQSAWLCSGIIRYMDIPYIKNGLVRIKHTRTQTALNADERQVNLKDAFAIGRDTGRRVMVVDDVCTTGATLNGCAKVLKQAGAIEVIGLTLARPLMDSMG